MKNIILCPICGIDSLTPYLDCLDHAVSRESFSLHQCPTCELLVTNPQPEDEHLSRYYQFEDYISHTNKGNNLVNKLYLLARHYTLKQKLNLIQQYNKPGKLLDVGCGTGSFLKFCKQHGWGVQGIEPSDSARAIATQIEKGIVASLHQNIKSDFNTITLWHVLEHLPNPNESIDILKSKLEVNGTIFIAVPNYKSYDATFYNNFWAAYDVPRHLWHFTKQSVNDLLKKHGLRITKIEPMKLDSYYVSLLSEKYKGKNHLSLKGFYHGLLTGLISNIKARKEINHSSLIYIIKK